MFGRGVVEVRSEVTWLLWGESAAALVQLQTVGREQTVSLDGRNISVKEHEAENNCYDTGTL